MRTFGFSTLYTYKYIKFLKFLFSLVRTKQNKKKNQVWALWSLVSALLRLFIGTARPTQWVGACLVPRLAALLPGSIMVRLMQPETSITRAEAETTVENTRERTAPADAGHNRLGCRFGPFDWSPDGSLMGAHGVTWVCIHVYVPVYIISMVFTCSPPTLFSPALWRGIFLWQSASEKAIKNSQTAHHNGRYHWCNVCSISFAVSVWNGFGYF